MVNTWSLVLTSVLLLSGSEGQLQSFGQWLTRGRQLTQEPEGITTDTPITNYPTTGSPTTASSDIEVPATEQFDDDDQYSDSVTEYFATDSATTISNMHSVVNVTERSDGPYGVFDVDFIENLISNMNEGGITYYS